MELQLPPPRPIGDSISRLGRRSLAETGLCVVGRSLGAKLQSGARSHSLIVIQIRNPDSHHISSRPREPVAQDQ